MTTATPVARNRMQEDGYWFNGRLIVHISGSEAGNMRLDIDLADFATPEEVAEHVQLEIPGETSPLVARGVVGDNGRFVISYFSSDIANAGHLPAEAVVCCTANGNENRMRPVEIVSAKQVESEQGKEAANIPASTPTTTYPTTVALLAFVGFAVTFIAAIVVLMQ
jgi:hypothetical protein